MSDQTGTPTLADLAEMLNTAGHAIAKAAAEGRFEDARDDAKRAWALAAYAHDVELAASLTDS